MANSHPKRAYLPRLADTMLSSGPDAMDDIPIEAKDSARLHPIADF